MQNWRLSLHSETLCKYIVLFLLHLYFSQLVCQKCDKVFKHKTTLKRHIEAHSERENFLCERCDAEFTQKDRERVHSLAKVNFGTKDYIFKTNLRHT